MANLSAFLARVLPGPALALLRAAGRLACEEHPGGANEAYLVGGPIRDLLLGADIADLDLSVVGDGQKFARSLAACIGGSVVATSEFGTAKIEADGLRADIATARRETYAEPGALPEVEPAGLDEDLARRDFTVHAMAVDLAPPRWGALIDPFGGVRDVAMRRLRILHENSFVDDPTRVLRALRYEARLGFAMDPGTLDRLTANAHYLGRVGPARVRAEIERILAEDTRHVILANAEERGVLAAIHPALRVPRRVAEAMRLAGAEERPRDLLFYVALIGTALTEDEARAVVARLDPPRAWRDVLTASPRYRAIAPLLDREDLRASEVVDMLQPFPAPVLEAQLALAPPTLRKERLASYLSELRFVKPDCTGDDLLRAGVPQGPLVGELLAALRRARLDRAVRTRDEELALVRRRLRTRR